MYTPKNCVDKLVEDFNEIERTYIKNSDWNGASQEWETKLMERQFYGMRDKIGQELHSGMLFCAVAEELVDKLKEGDAELIIKKFKAFSAQTILLDGSHK